MKHIFIMETKTIANRSLPCPYRLELLASLERVLCFCHTGNAAVFATSLMNPLGLSRGAVADGFPMLWKIFTQPNITFALMYGLVVDPEKWPLKDGYPAVASKRAQVLTYSIQHFMVRSSIYLVFRFSPLYHSHRAGGPGPLHSYLPSTRGFGIAPARLRLGPTDLQIIRFVSLCLFR